MKHPEYKNQNDMEIDTTVIVHRRPNMRANNHEMKMFIGRETIENLFEKQEIKDDKKKINIYFPESWCNILELRVILRRIQHFYPNIESVRIETHSVYLIQTCYNVFVQVLQDGDFHENGDKIYDRYCFPENGSEKLQVFGGNISFGHEQL